MVIVYIFNAVIIKTIIIQFAKHTGIRVNYDISRILAKNSNNKWI